MPKSIVAATERPFSIKNCGVGEAEFMSRVEELACRALEDQRTTANLVYPLVFEIRELYTKAYYGE